MTASIFNSPSVSLSAVNLYNTLTLNIHRMSSNTTYTTKRKRGGIYKFRHRDMHPGRGSCEEKLKQHCHMFAVTQIGDDYCTGFMLTTSAAYPDNFKMRPGDFAIGYNIEYHEPGGSYFLTAPLQKVHELETKLVGMLTPEGLDYIEKNAKGSPMTWIDYVTATCKGQ